ncbi:MAG: hypothetical protein K0R48_1507, partial [Gammaproteobacteria bacterium]|nr:hypothetical protein [Gammaproteobacteria bacterium]
MCRLRKIVNRRLAKLSVNYKVILSLLIFYFLGEVCFAVVTDANSRSGAVQNIEISSPQQSKGISSSVQQDTLLGLVGQLKSFFSWSEDKAVALELDGGPRVFRGNGTYGFALDDNTRVKLTAEYLRESLDFDFYSGDTMQWVQQGAVGASYEYLLKGGVIKNVAVGGHYSHAQSKDLPNIMIPESNGGYLIDQRRIAGGNDLNGNAEAAIQLWKDGVVALGPDYDQVHYNTKYEIQDGQNAQGLGGHIRLE